MTKKRMLLIDGHSLMYRAFFAIPPLTTPEGVHTNAVYGFLGMMLRLINEIQPTHLVVAFDNARNFRKDEYAGYKAKREKTPEELIGQFVVLKEILDTVGISWEEVPGFEGDDIIGTIAAKSEIDGYDVDIVSGDKDVFQLVDASTRVIHTKRGISETEIFDMAAIQEKYGFSPLQIIDLKGLMGDASDNIPGIPKVGEKTALKLIQEYGSVEKTIEAAADIKGKLGENIRNNVESAVMSKKLATIRKDAPVAQDYETYAYNGINPASSIEILNKYALKSLQGRIVKANASLGQMDVADKSDGTSEVIAEPEKEASPCVEYESIDESELLALEAKVKLNKKLALVFTKLADDRYGIAISMSEKVFVVQAAKEASALFVRNLFAAENLTICLHEAKLVMHAANFEEDALHAVLFDTELAAYLLNPTDNRPKLERIFEDMTGKSFPVSDMLANWQAELACQVKAIEIIAPLLEEKMHNDGMASLYFETELPLLNILYGMERHGIRVDQSILTDMGAEINGRIDALRSSIYGHAGYEFNINSTQQLAEVLFVKLGLPSTKKTKTGFSTDVTVLERLSPYHPIIDQLLEYRQLVKLLGTYVDGLAKLIDTDGIIHTTFNQTITATGRLSSTEPNLQNIPVRLEEGRRIRKAFKPVHEGNVLIAADYSQIELRVLAHMSHDKELAEAFLNDFDIHTHTASEIFNVPFDEVTPDIRSQAKAINFGILYGMGEFRLSKETGISMAKAKEFIANYFATFSSVKDFIEKTVSHAREIGYVTTILGRRRYIPELGSANRVVRQNAERIATNTPIQGSAADIIKVAMVNLHKKLRETDISAELLLQVHDELIVEAPADKATEIAAIMRDCMEQAIPLSVPVKVDVKIGPNWYEVEKVTLV